MTHTKPLLSAAILRALCVRASCDPRSIRKYLAGATVSPMPRTRIEEALRVSGYGHLVRNAGPLSAAEFDQSLARRRPKTWASGHLIPKHGGTEHDGQIRHEGTQDERVRHARRGQAACPPCPGMPPPPDQDA